MNALIMVMQLKEISIQSKASRKVDPKQKEIERNITNLTFSKPKVFIWYGWYAFWCPGCRMRCSEPQVVSYSTTILPPQNIQMQNYAFWQG